MLSDSGLCCASTSRFSIMLDVYYLRVFHGLAISVHQNKSLDWQMAVRHLNINPRPLQRQLLYAIAKAKGKVCSFT